MDAITDPKQNIALPHGGNLTAAEARFGRPAAGWLDLSTGINPFAYPVPEVPAAAWHRLPDAADQARLFTAARRYYGATSGQPMAVASGSQALIQWLPRLVPAKTGAEQAAILSPTYGEHAKCWADGGYTTEAIDELDAVADRHSIVVLANPNNPDGRRIEPAALLALADGLARRDALLVVDEAFVDVEPRLSVAAAAGRAGLVVLRSFGKFFGLAGLRLGIALGPPPFIAQLTDALGPWAVSGPGMLIATQAMNDARWIVEMRQQLRRTAIRLDQLLD
ncbi:MAG: aminotransferase class I/II-fold pyridoxal phosphate-dependent enzyme, partial [Dongiaceae bacterium]